jgi:hypothetical protein
VTAPAAPVARLREAATAVREASAKATKGICPGYVQGAVRHVARNCDIHCGHDEHYDGPDEPMWDRYDDAPWISLMRKEVGEPLAKWLEYVAELTVSVAEHRPDAATEDAPWLAPALALADAILAAVSS